MTVPSKTPTRATRPTAARPPKTNTEFDKQWLELCMARIDRSSTAEDTFIELSIGQPNANTLCEYTQGQYAGIIGSLGLLNSMVSALKEFARGQADRIAELEAVPRVKFTGIWRADSTHDEGHLVTHSGGLWYCNKRTEAKPGTSNDWSLVVKRGQAA